MDISRALTEIIDRSRFLTERLSNPFTTTNQKTGCHQNWILEQWLDSCSAGDRPHFLKRLNRLGLDLDTWHAVLYPGNITPVDLSSDWVRVLENALQPEFFQQSDQPDELDGVPAFTPLLKPFIIWSEQQLQQRSETSITWLTPQACRDLVSNLAENLSILCSRTLVLELNSARVLGQLRGESPKMRFRSFMRQTARGPEPMLRLFLEYPVLARLISTAILRWLRSCNTFLERLDRDQKTLSRAFNAGVPLGAVESIVCTSDPHRGGHTVMVLRFVDGPNLVYKPKDLRIEAAFQEFLKWLNHQLAPLPFRTIKVLIRDGYGYVEYVENHFCETTDQLKRFYRRAGMQLCLLYVLGATDFHNENVIACGEHPVLVDLESLFHPELRKEEWAGSVSDADAVAADVISNSVIRTGMLPNARLGDKGLPGYDISGLGGHPGQRYPRLVPVWLNHGTDEMRIDFEYAMIEPRSNLPFTTDSEFPLSDFVGDVVTGFGEFYDFLICHKDRIRTDCMPFKRMASLPVRFIVRPTQTYFDVLWKSFDPQYLRDGLQYSICFEILWRVVKQETIGNLVEEEIRQLHCLDIPYFGIQPAGTCIEVGDGFLIAGLIKEPSWNSAVSRLERIDVLDKRAQESIIRASFNISWDATPRPSASTVADYDNSKVPQSLDFTALAVEIADEICREALRSVDGSITWIGPEYVADYNQYRLQPLSPVLYGGKAGIAVFLAAVYDLTGISFFRDQTIAALRTILRLLHESKISNLVQQLGIGGISGVGSLVYSIVRCGVHLRDEQLFNEAERLAARIDLSLVAHDDLYDVVGGAAGWILALLALHKQRPNGPALARAIESAGHLLRGLDKPALSRRGQPQKRRFGFAHGYAGIGYAFCRLAIVTQIRQYREAEKRAVHYEYSERSALDSGNIRSDFHSREWEEFLGSWCYGFTGLTLAAVRGCSSLENRFSALFETVTELPLSPSDHLCCGNSGRIDALIELERTSSPGGPCGAALRIAQNMYTRRMQNRGWALLPMGIPGIGNHTLFRGTAGIGYEFLRLTDPTRIPSILVLD